MILTRRATFKVSLSIVFSVLLLVAFPCISSAETILMFNPDSPSGDVATLIEAANSYFDSKNLNLSLQPIAKYEQLKNMLSDASYVIMPRWAQNSLGDQYQLTPLLSPVFEDSIYYQKKLVTKKGAFDSLSKLNGQKVAATSLGVKTNSILDRILFSKTDISSDQLNFIFVGKDLDGLMAVKFGQVKAAVVSSHNFELIKGKKPFVIKGVEVLQSSDDVLRASLYKVGGGDASELTDAFKNMSQSKAGKKFLKKLNYKTWTDYPNE